MDCNKENTMNVQDIDEEPKTRKRFTDTSPEALALKDIGNTIYNLGRKAGEVEDEVGLIADLGEAISKALGIFDSYPTMVLAAAERLNERRIYEEEKQREQVKKDYEELTSLLNDNAVKVIFI